MDVRVPHQLVLIFFVCVPNVRGTRLVFLPILPLELESSWELGHAMIVHTPYLNQSEVFFCLSVFHTHQYINLSLSDIECPLYKSMFAPLPHCSHTMLQ